MAAPVSTASLTAMTARCTRRSPGTTVGGTVAAMETIHISGLKCVSLRVSSTRQALLTCSDTAAAKAVAKRTYKAAVELFAMLCEKYGLNPLTDICSHKEGCAKESHPTTATQSISGYSSVWDVRWIPSVKQSSRLWEAIHHPAARADIRRLWGQQRQQRSR